jgi:hypothetical protein
MKTIEQLLTPLIKEDIQYLLNLENRETKYTLLLTDNLNSQSKNNDKYDIQAVTQSGQGSLTQIPGTKAVQTPLQLIFQIPAYYQKDFIKIINTYILATNAVWSSVTDDLEDNDVATEEVYQYRLVWRAPIINGSPYNIQVKSDEFDSESLSVVQLILTGEVIHTSSFAMDDEDFYIFLEDVELEVNDWNSSDETTYNSTSEDMKESIINTESFPSVPSGYPAANYPVGYMLKVSDGSLPESVVYYIIELETVIQDTYVKIEGITSESEPLGPVINQTNLIDQYNTQKDVAGDNQTLNLTLAIQTSNILHERLLRLYYESRTSTSFDVLVKRVRKSLSIVQSGIEMTMTLNRYKQNGFEYLTLTLNRK